MAARSDAADRELVINRVFDAPRELVFKAWTDPEHLMRWWGPRGHTVTSCKMDVRAAGAWRFCMRSPAGIDQWQTGAYREIVPPERLVFSYAFEDAAGQPGHQSVVTVTFADQDGKTALTVYQAVFESVAVRDDHVRGWSEALERLGEYLAARGERELVINRIFDAPRELVFKAWIEPQHLFRWFGPHGFTVPSYTLDPRPGGGWRCCMVSPQGGENWVRGVFREVLEPERLAFTWAHENADGTLGHETLITVTFADLGEKTALTLRQGTFESIAARDDHRDGWSEALEDFGEYVAHAARN